MDKHFPSLWQLRVFEAVARLENVSRASRELLRSQPAITSSIAQLEALVGVTLFERTTTGTYPTPTGVAVLVRTRRILAAAAEAVAALRPKDAAPDAAAARVTRTQMRCIIALAECPSFSSAAREVGVSKASLQRAARQLEQNLGCQLYRHTAAGVTATSAGVQFAERMRTIIAQIETMISDVKQYGHPEDRRVVVGVLLLDPTMVLTHVIKEMIAAFDDIRVVVVSAGYDDLLRKLHAQQIDLLIGILKQPENADEVVEETLYRERYTVVARRGHPLTGKRELSIDELRRCEWILPQHGSPRRLAFEQIFFDGPPPAASVETYSLSTIRSLLAESDMLTVLSLTEALSEQSIGALSALSFEVPGEGPLIGLTLRKAWMPNAVQTAFIRSARRACQRIAAERLAIGRGL